jgi:hypothetical protein
MPHLCERTPHLLSPGSDFGLAPLPGVVKFSDREWDFPVKGKLQQSLRDPGSTDRILDCDFDGL